MFTDLQSLLIASVIPLIVYGYILWTNVPPLLWYWKNIPRLKQDTINKQQFPPIQERPLYRPESVRQIIDGFRNQGCHIVSEFEALHEHNYRSRIWLMADQDATTRIEIFHPTDSPLVALDTIYADGTWVKTLSQNWQTEVVSPNVWSQVIMTVNPCDLLMSHYALTASVAGDDHGIVRKTESLQDYLDQVSLWYSEYKSVNNAQTLVEWQRRQRSYLAIIIGCGLANILFLYVLSLDLPSVYLRIFSIACIGLGVVLYFWQKVSRRFLPQHANTN